MVTGDINVIAEIKCNKPINNGFKFGAQQKTGLIKDITGLLEGKSKVKSVNPAEAFKFLVIYDFGDHTLLAAQHLIKNLSADLKGKVLLYKEDSVLDKDKAYIVLIK